MKAPIYQGEPIRNLNELAEVYEISTGTLWKIVNLSSALYRANAPIIKSNGKIRQIYRVVDPLARLQRQTVDRIFRGVEFPPYLQGSIPDSGDNLRGYIIDAMLHAPYNLLMTFDIEDFFPSIGSGLVFRIWRDFFGFPVPVAKALTMLTTYKQFVPQGASTSPYLANLVFWDREPQLEARLAEYGFFYTRFVDDINVSTNLALNKEMLASVTNQVYGMMASRKFRPNRRKRRIQTRNGKKLIHNLNISAGYPTKPKAVRGRIRAIVDDCEELAQIDCSSEEFHHLYARAMGLLADMKRLHPNEAQLLLNRLQDIKPVRKDSHEILYITSWQLFDF